VVSLRGKVPDEARKKIALETAREVADVEKVVDLLEVEG
jgi:osmotically-inducible protein OsmY